MLRVLDESNEPSELLSHGHEVSKLSFELWFNKVGSDHLALLELDCHLLAALSCHPDGFEVLERILAPGSQLVQVQAKDGPETICLHVTDSLLGFSMDVTSRLLEQRCLFLGKRSKLFEGYSMVLEQPLELSIGDLVLYHERLQLMDVLVH